MIDDFPLIETIPADALAEALAALATLCAADNCNYQRDTMRYAGMFDDAKAALLKCGIDRRRGAGNPELGVDGPVGRSPALKHLVGHARVKWMTFAEALRVLRDHGHKVDPDWHEDGELDLMWRLDGNVAFDEPGLIAQAHRVTGAHMLIQRLKAKDRERIHCNDCAQPGVEPTPRADYSVASYPTFGDGAPSFYYRCATHMERYWTMEGAVEVPANR